MKKTDIEALTALSRWFEAPDMATEKDLTTLTLYFGQQVIDRFEFAFLTKLAVRQRGLDDTQDIKVELE